MFYIYVASLPVQKKDGLVEESSSYLILYGNTLHKLDMLQAKINSEKNNYKEAIRNDKSFEDVKVIYLKIKELQKEADVLMQHVNELQKV